MVHAKLEGHVEIRDDKGTPDRGDDLRISMNYVEYDEAARTVYTASSVAIVDRDMRVDGDDLLINLRPQTEGVPGGSGGFNGAKDAYLRKNVHIVINNVGSTGILPGPSTQKQRNGESTPLDLRCDGEMIIVLPEPTAPVLVGPPSPPGQTVAEFDRNVEVLRGKVDREPDKLNCDHLRLILMPADKSAKRPTQVADAGKAKPKADAKAPAEDEGGPLTDLTLRESYATGHNVRIESAAQRIKARCNELIHKKRFPDAADITYLRGDATSKLIVDKVDVSSSGEKKGQVTSCTRIVTIDATIEDWGQGNDFLKITARGPGTLEIRPGIESSVEQTARWLDSLIVENVRNKKASKTSGADVPHYLKQITLLDHGSFSDVPSKTDLTADEKIYVWLKPKVKKKSRPSSRPSPRRHRWTRPRVRARV